MNDPTLRPDDPRLTAYALGELSGDERAHVEAALRENPALRALVEDIRTTAAQIESALTAEAMEDIAEIESMTEPHAMNGHVFSRETGVARILPGSDPRKLDGGDDYARLGRGAKLLRFPQLYVILATAAAACFAFYVHLRNDEYRSREQVAETIARIAQKRRETEARVAAQSQTMPVALAPVTVPAADPGKSVAARAPDGSSTPVVSETAAPPPSGAPSETQLGLLAISPAKPDGVAEPPPLITFGMDRAVSVATDTTAGVTTLGEQSSSTATKTSPQPPALPKMTETGSVATAGGSLVAAAPVAISGRVATAAPFNAPGSTPAQLNDEIVRLDTIEVTADRIQPLLSSSVFNNFTTITRGMREPEPLPRPPVGAEFARTKAAYASDNDFVRVTDSPSSKFSVDIDRAGYANLRRLIEQGTRPRPDAVRIEELLNYFPYGYAAPADNQAFAASLEVASAPWAPDHRLVRIGLKARGLAAPARAPANLVFVIDVSASMSELNKLPLVRESIRLLVNKLRPDDRVAIVAYGAEARVALPSTPVARASEIFAALNALRPAGAGDGARGMQLGYELAIKNFAVRSVNRVFLCTEGAFNALSASEHELLRLIDEKTKSGIALDVYVFGRATEPSTPLERLARRADATCVSIDSHHDAEQLLVEPVSGSLAVIARDVKVQVEFNPTKVLAYRLIGYENRPLRREDYSEETGAVGEVGAGETVTALYEVVPALPGDAASAAKSPDYVKYGAEGLESSRLEMPDTRRPPGNELLTVNVRYRTPNGFLAWPRTQAFAVVDAGKPFAEASADFRFAAAVAEFGMILRGSPHKGSGSMRDVVAWANAAAGTGEDPRGYRRDFVALARKARVLVR